MIPLAYRQALSTPAPEHETVARFARFLSARRFSPHTVRLYLGAVNRWLAAGGMPGHIDAALLTRYLAGRRDAVAVNTVNLDLKALRSFYRVQVAAGDVAAADLAWLPRQRKAPSRLPRPLSEGQVGEVLGSLPLDTFLGLRDYAMLRVLFECGLRASELASLELGSLMSDDTIFVRGKGSRDRYVPMTAQLHGVLAGYIHARARCRPGKRAALWVRQDGKPLRNGRSVWEIVSRRLWALLGARSGLHRLRATGKAWQGHYPHQLRATFATALLERGCPITAIAQMMGHSDVATTALYLGVDLEHLRRAASHHPRALRASGD